MAADSKAFKVMQIGKETPEEQYIAGASDLQVHMCLVGTGTYAGGEYVGSTSVHPKSMGERAAVGGQPRR